MFAENRGDYVCGHSVVTDSDRRIESGHFTAPDGTVTEVMDAFDENWPYASGYTVPMYSYYDNTRHYLNVAKRIVVKAENGAERAYVLCYEQCTE